MKYKNIKQQIIKENNENLIYQLDKLNMTQEDKTPEEVLNYIVRWVLDKRTQYKGTYEEQKQKVIIALKRKYQKQLNKELDYLSKIEEAKPLPNNLVITIEWKPSKMWGKNPIATDNYNNTSGSIGGCGYDKLSTATARILNQHLYFIKLMCDIKEEALKNPELKDLDNNTLHRKIFSYGSGYGIIPRFEGGVGVSCHETIINKLGLKWQNITSTNNIYVFLISFNFKEMI